MLWALLMLPCTRKELAAFWVRSAISSVLIVPWLASVLVSLCWLTSTRANCRAARAGPAIGRSGCAPRLAASALSDRNFSSHSGAGALAETPTS
jgi:hypothetical protein